jgi:ABC-2 type transport system permease protein
LWRAPLIIAALLVATIVIGAFPGGRHVNVHMDNWDGSMSAERQAQAFAVSQIVPMAPLYLIMALVLSFYLLDSLYAERRDRSILFWKSLPVSDRTTILAKACIPLLALPALIFVIVVITQLLMLLWSTAVLLPSGLAGSTWAHFHWFTQSLLLLYGLIVLVLWHAPLYAWLLLISGWAKRACYLWAVLPLLAIAAVEKIVFNSAYFASFLKYRLIGGVGEAFVFKAPQGTDSLSRLTVLNFLSTPGLWIGLVLAAIFIDAAVRLRRDREPV